MIYLCHKCSGHLTNDAKAISAYGCQCISSYVRDWQEPTHPDDIRHIQRKYVRDTLRRYADQPETNHHVQWARRVLAKLCCEL